MVLPVELQIPIAVGIGVFLLVLAAERLHERRCRAVARLATGPTGRPRRWVGGVWMVKAIALGGMAWASVTLYYGSGGVFSQRETTEDRREERRHGATTRREGRERWDRGRWRQRLPRRMATRQGDRPRLSVQPHQASQNHQMPAADTTMTASRFGARTRPGCSAGP